MEKVHYNRLVWILLLVLVLRGLLVFAHFEPIQEENAQEPFLDKPHPIAPWARENNTVLSVNSGSLPGLSSAIPSPDFSSHFL